MNEGRLYALRPAELWTAADEAAEEIRQHA